MNHSTLPQPAIDPVSRRPIAVEASSVSTIYRGSIYVFQSRGNRELFERNPERFLADGTVNGRPVPGPVADRPRRRSFF